MSAGFWGDDGALLTSVTPERFVRNNSDSSLILCFVLIHYFEFSIHFKNFRKGRYYKDCHRLKFSSDDNQREFNPIYFHILLQLDERTCM